MERIYRLLPWLSVTQAVEYIGLLTKIPCNGPLLLQLCKAHECSAYIDCNGRKGTTVATAFDPDSDANTEVNVDGFGHSQLLNIESIDKTDTLLVLGECWTHSGDSATCPWWMESAHGKGALKQELLFRPIDIQRLAAKITGAVESTEEEPKPSYLLAIAALMELLTAPVEFPRPHGMNQEAIKGDILDKFPLRGLSDRNLEEIFARANKAVAKARARLE